MQDETKENKSVHISSQVDKIDKLLEDLPKEKRDVIYSAFQRMISFDRRYSLPVNIKKLYNKMLTDRHIATSSSLPMSHLQENISGGVNAAA